MESSESNSFYQCVPKLEVPRDEEGFIKSFALEEVNEFKEFFEKYGFVVIRDILTKEECEKSIDDIWNYNARYKIDRNDRKTWINSKWRFTGLWNEGIIGYDPIFSKQALQNRRNPNIYKIFMELFGRKDLLISHDRYGLFRPVKSSTEDNNIEEEWKTMRNIHMDMNPWDFVEREDSSASEAALSSLQYRAAMDFIAENNEVGCLKEKKLNIQALINFADNREEDGGFHLIPGFHHHLEEWVKKTKKFHKGNFVIIPEDVIPPEAAIRITVKAGSVVIWNQCVAHGSAPNNSHRHRYAQFFRVFPANPMNPERRERRIAGLKKFIKSVNIETEFTEPERKFLGLEPYD